MIVTFTGFYTNQTISESNNRSSLVLHTGPLRVTLTLAVPDNFPTISEDEKKQAVLLSAVTDGEAFGHRGCRKCRQTCICRAWSKYA